MGTCCNCWGQRDKNQFDEESTIWASHYRLKYRLGTQGSSSKILRRRLSRPTSLRKIQRQRHYGAAKKLISHLLMWGQLKKKTVYGLSYTLALVLPYILQAQCQVWWRMSFQLFTPQRLGLLTNLRQQRCNQPVPVWILILLANTNSLIAGVHHISPGLSVLQRLWRYRPHWVYVEFVSIAARQNRKQIR